MDLFGQGKFDAARQAALPRVSTPGRRGWSAAARCRSSPRSRWRRTTCRQTEATLTRLLAADPDFQPDIFDSPRFVRLLAGVRSRNSTPTVTSVSKSKEPLAEAPATVIVVTGEEIERRGYTDL